MDLTCFKERKGRQHRIYQSRRSKRQFFDMTKVIFSSIKIRRKQNQYVSMLNKSFLLIVSIRQSLSPSILLTTITLQQNLLLRISGEGCGQTQKYWYSLHGLKGLPFFILLLCHLPVFKVKSRNWQCDDGLTVSSLYIDDLI